MESETKGPRMKGEEVKLRECPFCGGNAETHCKGCMEPYVENHWVECVFCGARIEVYASEQGAILAWNHRPAPAPVAPLRIIEAVIEDSAQSSGWLEIKQSFPVSFAGKRVRCVIEEVGE